MKFALIKCVAALVIAMTLGEALQPLAFIVAGLGGR